MRALRALAPLVLAGCSGAVAPEPSPPRPAPPATVTASAAAPAPDAGVAPASESASIEVEGSLARVHAGGTEHALAIADLRSPGGDPAAPDPRVSIVASRGGVLFTGASDGTVTAWDAADHRRFSLGLRGAITGLLPLQDGVVATTAGGVIARIDGAGHVTWEQAIAGEPLSPPIAGDDGAIFTAGARGLYAVTAAGAPLFTHRAESEAEDPPLALRSDDAAIVALGEKKAELYRVPRAGPHPPIPSRAALAVLAFRRELRADVLSVVPVAADDAWITIAHDERFAVDRVDKLLRFDGHAVSEQPSPLRRAELDQLALGPGGRPWIFGRRVHDCCDELGSAPSPSLAMELDGGRFRERAGAPELFGKRETRNVPVIAAGGGRLTMCVGGSNIDPTSRCLVRAQDAWREQPLPPDAGLLRVAAWIGGELWIAAADNGLHRLSGSTWREVPGVDRPVVALAGTSASDVWVATEESRTVHHFDGASWTPVRTPIDQVRSFLCASPGEVWIAGAGGLGHGDVHGFARVAGISGALDLVVSRAPGDLWASGRSGLWHGTAPASLPPARAVTITRSEDALSSATAALPLGPDDSGRLVARITLPVKGGQAIASAIGAASLPGGPIWLSTGDRVVEIDEAHGSARAIVGGAPVACARCAFPEAPGRGWVISALGLVHVADGKAEAEAMSLDRLTSIHGAPGGALWVAGAGDDDGMPHAAVRVSAGSQLVTGLPAAAYTDVAAASESEAWLAGGMIATTDTLRAWPAGEGILAHVVGASVERFRSPSPLLAVAVAGPGEAFAVGAAGVVIHVRSGVAERLQLASKTWLRSVFALAPDDVWIGGDDATLIHFDGRAFHRVPAVALGPRAAFTGIAAASRDRLWIISPSGLLRVTSP